MSPQAPLRDRLLDRFPRVSGDEPSYTVKFSKRFRFSPREWG